MEKQQLISRGRTAEVYALGSDKIVKLFYSWCPTEWITKEVKSATTVSDLPLAAPRCFGTTEIDGRQGIIFERVAGPSMMRQMVLRPWRAGKLARGFAARNGALSL